MPAAHLARGGLMLGGGLTFECVECGEEIGCDVAADGSEYELQCSVCAAWYVATIARKQTSEREAGLGDASPPGGPLSEASAQALRQGLADIHAGRVRRLDLSTLPDDDDERFCELCGGRITLEPPTFAPDFIGPCPHGRDPWQRCEACTGAMHEDCCYPFRRED